MSQRPRRDKTRRVWTAAAISVLAHLVLLAVFLPPAFEKWVAPEDQKEEQSFEVTTVIEPEQTKKAPDEPEKVATPEEVKKPEPKERPEKPEEKKLEQQKLDRKVVQQQTNEEMPDEADYLSQKANKVDEQTRAKETTDKNVLPGKELPDEIEEKTGSEPEPREAEELASRARPVEKPERRRPEPDKTTPPQPQPEPESTPQEKAQEAEGITKTSPSPDNPSRSPVVKPQKKPDPRELFQPSAKDYDKVFGERDKELEGQMEEHYEGRRLLAGYEKRKKAIRASLENHITEVKPGNHTGVNAKPAVYADYISRIHRKIHARWGASFLPMLDTQYPAGHPLNDPSLNSELEFVIDAKSGQLDAVNIVDSSGETMFDAEAVAVSHMVGPHRHPPGEIVSPDGKVYVHWNFWRDQRQCGPFGASIFIVNNMKDRGGRPGVEVEGGGR